MVKIRSIEAIALAILIIQAIILFTAFNLDPIVQQEKFGFMLSISFVLTASLLYIYSKGSDIFPEKVLELDEEWIAIGIAFAILIILFIIYTK